MPHVVCQPCAVFPATGVGTRFSTRMTGWLGYADRVWLSNADRVWLGYADRVRIGYADRVVVCEAGAVRGRWSGRDM